MSCQRECGIIETSPGKWYLLLAHHEYGELNPHEASAYGPFKTEDAADDYLRDYFSNPGGLWVEEYDPERKLGSDALQMISIAKAPKTANSMFGPIRWR